MRLNFSKLAVCRFKNRGSNIHGIPRIFDQRAFVTVEVVQVEKVAPCDGDSIHEEPGEITEPYGIVKGNDEDWGPSGIMTVKKVGDSGLRLKMRAL